MHTLENGIERSESKTVGSFLRREPLVYFIALATLLFALDGVRPEERHKAIDAFLEDEISYRKASKQELDTGDSRIRRNLILKMRGRHPF